MIYLDNAATSYPKPRSVSRRVTEALQLFSFNSGRGGYKESLRAAEKIYAVREQLAALFGALPENIVFTKNCTEALNYAIKGLVRQGGHIVISSLEHNSVSRVVQKLQDDGVAEYTPFAFDDDGEITEKRFQDAIKHNTCLAVCTFASNAFGVMLPIRRIGKLCREKGIPFIVDAAQGAGSYPIDMERDNIDVLCAPGHKGLLGPMGSGFLAVREGLSLSTVIEGGTGSASLSLRPPEGLPERLEAGTLNNSGILGLGAGLEYLGKVSIEAVYRHELSLIQTLYRFLDAQKEIRLYTPFPEEGKAMPLLSFTVDGCSGEDTALRLAGENICVRGGYHCAPLAHRHYHTLDTGTVRVSVGPFTTPGECNRFMNVVKKF